MMSSPLRLRVRSPAFRQSLLWAILADVSLAGSLAEHVAALRGPDALAEWKARRALAAAGDAAVPELKRLAADPGPLPPRWLAIELLGEIATPAARDALVELLAAEKKDLAVRNQLCIVLGALRERKAVPALTEWLGRIGPGALNDVHGPKEFQPSTVFARHLEALEQIGDPSALPAIEKFLRDVPKGVGYGGFISNFVLNAAEHAAKSLREREAFWAAVRKQPGLDAKLAPLFAHLGADPVARFRLHEDEVIRRNEQGRAVLRRLASHERPAVAAAAKALLERYNALPR
ncbi:MAG: HEAT repeat domain-containing protein [Planctomycetes bacterium]|nr:HEAT repeat domain-containing protein [Planctomycetota bacterium]